MCLSTSLKFYYHHNNHLIIPLQSELDQLSRDTTEAAARRDALAQSIRDKEQALEGARVAVNEATATLDAKRAEEASGRAALADTYVMCCCAAVLRGLFCF